MPKLSPLHWVAFVFLFVFYGFAVFALTRDYDLRHPVADPQSKQCVTDSPEQLHQRADQFFAEQRYAEAVQVYQRLLEIDPQDAEVDNDLGLALLYTGDKPGAITHLQTAVAQAPNLQRLWLSLGFVHLQSGNLAESRAALEHARDLDPNSAIGKEAVRLLDVLNAH